MDETIYTVNGVSRELWINRRCTAIQLILFNCSPKEFEDIKGVIKSVNRRTENTTFFSVEAW